MKALRNLFTTLAVVCAALACVVSANPAMGKEKAPPRAEDTPQIDENEILGEAKIVMKMEFVKFQLDDKKEWDNHEYVDGAKTLIIKGIDRSGDHTVTLTPRESGYEPVTLTIKNTDFKRTVTKTKGRTQTIAFLAHYSASFTKVAAPKADKPADKPAGK
ncbi:MAG: hypothetical protein HY902_14565 [Deltaproteobacteria bacterium]|nr:hypothetical protein [Deltaproteobacteria bacterium]